MQTVVMSASCPRKDCGKVSGYTRHEPHVPAEATVLSPRPAAALMVRYSAGLFSIKVCPLDEVSDGVAPSYTGHFCLVLGRLPEPQKSHKSPGGQGFASFLFCQARM